MGKIDIDEYCFIKEAQDKFFATEQAHTMALNLAVRALCCHCECLGMNAENSQRAMLGQPMAYPDEAYLSCMQKWGLITEKGEPKL